MKANRFKEKKRSNVEEEIFNILKRLLPTAVIYTNYPLHRIVKCNNKKLSIDFYISTFDVLLEYHGEHHYKVVDYGNTEKSAFIAQRALKERIALDKEKEDTINKNNKNMNVIPYFEWKKLKTENEKEEYLWKKLKRL